MTRRNIVIAAGIALLALIGYMPFYSGADQFRPAVRSRLEQALGRKVDTGEVRFSLLTGPSVTVSEVVIHEDPSLGIEPVAYVSEMTIRPKLLMLLLGRVEISSLRLEQPSLNLSRGAQGEWNWKAFLPAAQSKSVVQATRFPEIEVRAGRVNFKLADRKSVFYFTDVDADVTLSPDSDGAFSLRFTGAPARSDKPAQGFGRMKGRGRFWLRETIEPEVDVTVDLERSFLEEILKLTTGRDFGLHAVLTARTRIAGPLSKMQLTGRMEFGEIPRWAILPGKSNALTLNYKGEIDYRAQNLSIATEPASPESRPVSLRFRTENFLGEPRWGILAGFAAIPLAPLPEFAKVVGISLPDGWKLKGTASGVVGLSSRYGMNGLLGVRDASIAMGDDNQAALAQADILFANNRLESRGAQLEFSRNQSVVVDSTYDFERPRWEWRWETRSLDMPTTEKLRALCAAPQVPWLGAWTSGTWKGMLRLESTANDADQWQGNIEVRNMQVKLTELALPVELAQATVNINPARMRLVTTDAQTGEIKWTGEFVRSSRQSHFKITVRDASQSALEALWAPVLKRNRSFFSRTFSKENLPDWIRTKRVQGTIGFDHFSAGKEEFEDVKASITWNGATVEAKNLQFKSAGTPVKAHGKLDLSVNNPQAKFERDPQ